MWNALHRGNRFYWNTHLAVPDGGMPPWCKPWPDFFRAAAIILQRMQKLARIRIPETPLKSGPLKRRNG